MNQTNQQVVGKIAELYKELFSHDGCGKLEVEMRIYKHGTKEILVRSGREFRFVVPWQDDPRKDSAVSLGANKSV